MNRFRFIDSESPLSPDELAEFEREIGAALPADYKRFLLESNGGWLEPEAGLHWNGRLCFLPTIRSLLPDAERGVRRALRNLREIGVTEYLPIASTTNNDEIAMPLRTGTDAVVLGSYSYVNQVATAVTWFPLAESFTAFLDLLVIVPQIYCPIVELGERGSVQDLETYLSAGGSLDELGKHGLTILCEAIKFENEALIEACVARGAKWTQAVRIAVVNRRPDLVRRFVAAGADVNEPDEYGMTPIRYVPGVALPGEEGRQNRAMQQLLIELGAKRREQSP